MWDLVGFKVVSDNLVKISFVENKLSAYLVK